MARFTLPRDIYFGKDAMAELKNLRGYQKAMIVTGGSSMQKFGFLSQLEQTLHEAGMVLVGAGYLGKALVNYENFKRRGFVVRAIFDRDPEIVGKTFNGIKVNDIATLETYLLQNPTEIGIICTPASAAQNIADILVKSGIKGIWNFAPVSLKVPDDVYVEHVHISESLMVLSFKIRQQYST